MKKLLIRLLIGSVTIPSLFIAASVAKNSQLFMPNGYKEIKKSINTLDKFNDLGDQQIRFTITPGYYAAWRAKEFGLCKSESCTYIRRLNPFKKYSDETINEIIRQDKIFGTNYAYATSSGNISLSQSTFDLYRNKKGYLECVLAHEVSHVLNNHSYQESLKRNQLEGLSKKDIEHKTMAKRRDFELEADFDSIEMVFNSGIDPKACIDSLRFDSYLSGYYYTTKKDSTHPGLEERISKNNEFLEHHKKNSIKPQSSKKRGKWEYRRKENVLLFRPN